MTDDDLLSQLIWELASASNQRVKKRCNNAADLTSLLPLVLFVGGTIEFLRRPIMPRWHDFWWWSYSIFRDLNSEKRKVPHFHQQSASGEGERLIP